MACLLHRGHGPHTRRTDAAKQRTVAYLSGRGQRGQMFLPWVLITSYTTALARQCKCGRFSLPPYSKQERPLFTAALEQTSNVPTARDRDVGWPIVQPRTTMGLAGVTGVQSTIATSPLPSPLRCVPSPHFDTCVTRRVSGRCPPLNVPVCWAPAMKTNFCHMSPPVWHINEVRIFRNEGRISEISEFNIPNYVQYIVIMLV